MPLSLRRKRPVLQRGRAVFAMWRLLLGRQRVHFGCFLKKDEKMSRKCLAVSGEVCTFALAFAQKSGARPPEGARGHRSLEDLHNNRKYKSTGISKMVPGYE